MYDASGASEHKSTCASEECMICHQTIKIPAYTYQSGAQRRMRACRCSARYCSACLDEYFRNARQHPYKCVICPAHVSGYKLDWRRMVYLDAMTGDIRCPNSPACDWSGSRGSLRHVHSTVCPEARVSCKFNRFGCAHVGARTSIEAHESECEFRPDACRVCCAFVDKQKLLQHYEAEHSEELSRCVCDYNSCADVCGTIDLAMATNSINPLAHE